MISAIASTGHARAEDVGGLDKLADACVQQQSQDDLCMFIIDLKQIGDDSVEAVKQYIVLDEYEYYALTVINAIATARVRIKMESPFRKNATQTIDVRPDSIMISFETRF
jgi:type IV secretory pathway TrbF-like protein